MTLLLERRGAAAMLLALLISLAGPASSVWAQDAEAEPAAEATEEAAAEEEAPAEDLGVGYALDNTVLFVAAVFVFFMQAGFAMVESGFNSSKNAVNIMFKNAMDVCVGVLLFFIIGFGIMYPTSYDGAEASPYIGFGGFGLDGYARPRTGPSRRKSTGCSRRSSPPPPRPSCRAPSPVV